MSDPDADAVLASFEHPEAANDSDAAAVLASFSAPKTSSKPGWQLSLPNQPPPIEPKVDPHLLTNMGKGVAGMVTHAAGTLADVATGTAPGQGSHAERWAAPFAITDPTEQLDPSQIRMHQAVSNAYDKVAGTGPAATEIKTRIPQALEAIGAVLPFAKGAAGVSAPAEALDAQTVLNRAAANSPQSMGASAAAPSLQQVSPELHQAISNAAQRTGGAVAPDVMARRIEADTLPVKMQLTTGQATQDPALLSNEQNMRAQQGGALAKHFNDQNGQLVQNVQALRDRVGPDVFSANPIEHGDTLIKAYKDKGDAADADISAKYQALKDVNGGNFPVDAAALQKNATAELHKELLFDHAPKAIMSTLGRLADSGSMTFENFESLRTNLARIQRSVSADGNEKAAAGVIRNSMEQLPLAPGAASLKPLADTARAAARAQFDAVAADPAYKAAINDEVTPDRFVQKFVTGGSRDNVALMKENLAHDSTATQTMGVAVLDHLRQAAGIDPMGNGNFSQAGFNKNLQALSPKLRSLVDPNTADQLETLGNVARYTQAQPRGSYVNNSNTLVAALAGHAANAAEGIANVKAGGFPVGTIVRNAIGNRTTAKAVREALDPGGGLTRLSDVAKQP